MLGARASVASVSARTSRSRPRSVRCMAKAAAPMGALGCTGRCVSAVTALENIGSLASCEAQYQGPGGDDPLYQPWPAALLRRDPEPAVRPGAERADQVWVGDITYLKVGTIYRYLAVVMDKYSRRVVGWSYGPRKDVNLTLKALNRAVHSRRPSGWCSIPIEASSTRRRFQRAHRRARLTQSMNRPGKSPTMPSSNRSSIR